MKGWTKACGEGVPAYRIGAQILLLVHPFPGAGPLAREIEVEHAEELGPHAHPAAVVAGDLAAWREQREQREHLAVLSSRAGDSIPVAFRLSQQREVHRVPIDKGRRLVPDVPGVDVECEGVTIGNELTEVYGNARSVLNQVGGEPDRQCLQDMLPVVVHAVHGVQVAVRGCCRITVEMELGAGCGLGHQLRVRQGQVMEIAVAGNLLRPGGRPSYQTQHAVDEAGDAARTGQSESATAQSSASFRQRFFAAPRAIPVLARRAYHEGEADAVFGTVPSAYPFANPRFLTDGLDQRKRAKSASAAMLPKAAHAGPSRTRAKIALARAVSPLQRNQFPTP